MAGPTATAQFGLPDPLTAPTSFTAVVQQLNQLALATPLSGGPFAAVILAPSNQIPAVQDQNKIWFVLDPNGRPIDIRAYYNGPNPPSTAGWRRFYTGKTGQLTLFSGNPATFFDANHVGIIGAEWDGWALCTPQGNAKYPNIVPDLSDKFVVGGGAFSTPFNSWTSKVGDGTTILSNAATDHAGVLRGQSTYVIPVGALPPLSFQITGANFSSGAGTGIPRVLVDGDHGNRISTDTQDQDTIKFPTNPQPVTQSSVSSVPPYYILAYAAWVGYL